MRELEKILEEIDNIYINETDFGIECNFENRSDIACDNCYECIKETCKDIIRKHMNDGWIPVKKENLPNYEVLACDKYGEEMFGYLEYDSDAEEVICDSDICLMSDVIAWMEKPEPYSPERSEE